MKKKRLTGFVLWTDDRDKEGIIQDFKGVDYYFNEWSLPKTIYLSTKSRKFPGLFRDRHTKCDSTFFKLKANQGVEFEQFEDKAWAINVTMRNDLADDVISHRLCRVLESIDNASADPRPWYRRTWLPYYDRRLTRLIGNA